MTRLSNLGTAFTLARAKYVVRRDGFSSWLWQLVSHYGESLPGSGTEPTKSKAQRAGQIAEQKHNAQIAGKRVRYKRQNVKRGSPQNKISLFTGIT